MRTDMADLAQIFADLFDRPVQDEGPALPDGQLRDPDPALNAPPQRFADIYGADGDLLARLAQTVLAAGDREEAALIGRLAACLATLELPEDEPARGKRLINYVYPVV